MTKKALTKELEAEALKKDIYRAGLKIAKELGTKDAKYEECFYTYQMGDVTLIARTYEEHCWDTSYLAEVTIKKAGETVYSARGDDCFMYTHYVNTYAPGAWEQVIGRADTSKKPMADKSVADSVLDLRRKEASLKDIFRRAAAILDAGAMRNGDTLFYQDSDIRITGKEVKSKNGSPKLDITIFDKTSYEVFRAEDFAGYQASKENIRSFTPGSWEDAFNRVADETLATHETANQHVQKKTGRKPR